MLTMSSCLQDYVIENANFFNEFDKTNFINNAALALNKDTAKLSLSIKGNAYSHILEKTISHINEIEINSYAVSEFVTKILGSGRVESAKLTMRDITKVDNIVMKPQYLAEAVTTYKEIINGIASGKYDTDKIKSIYANMHTYIDTIKKRLVSSPININITPKEMLDHNISETVDVTTSYLENVVLAFLQDFLKKKKELTTEISLINTTVYTTVAELKKVVEDVNIGVSLNKIDDTKKKLMLNYTYNMVRAILEGVAFITYAAIRKAHQFEECVVECQNIYNTLTLTFHDVINIIESGLYDNRSITADDAYDIAEKLIDGKNDVFVELANNIVEYHKGYISNNVSLSSEVSGGEVTDYVTNMLSQNMYDSELYKDIVKVFIEISNGLDIVAKNYDDRLLVFDDIVKKSGFSLTLIDRFHNNIKSIEDMSKYGITNLDIGNSGEKEHIYYMILSEISDYPRVTESIAKVAREVKIRTDYIEELFNEKHDTELAYSETMQELKTFLASFKDQFKELTMTIVKGLYTRLKELANKADECIDNVYPSSEDSYIESDFCKEAVLANLEEIDSINDLVMESMLKDYYSEREFKERGVRLVYEEVKVVDNSGEGAGTSSVTNKLPNNKVGDLIKSVSEWFKKTLDSFSEVIGRSQAKNSKFINDYKDYLTSRKYINVQITILSYDKISSEQVITDIGKMITAVGTMTSENLKNINSYEDLRAKLINFGPKFTQDGDEKTTITNYYKVGNNPAEPVTYSNSEIQNLVVNNMIPYCDAFYQTYKPNVEKQLNNLKTAVENIHKTYVTESLTDADLLDTIFTEADAPAQQPAAQTPTPQQNTTSTQTTTTVTAKPEEKTTDINLATKAGWMTKCVQVYSGCVLNAIRDRNRDYFEALRAFVPKGKTPNNNTTAAETPATQPTNTPEQEPTQK